MVKISDISKIDKNFAVKPVEVGVDTVFFNVLEEPFKIYGLILPKDENDIYRCIPLSVAEATSEGVFLKLSYRRWSSQVPHKFTLRCHPCRYARHRQNATFYFHRQCRI